MNENIFFIICLIENYHGNRSFVLNRIRNDSRYSAVLAIRLSLRQTGEGEKEEEKKQS